MKAWLTPHIAASCACVIGISFNAAFRFNSAAVGRLAIFVKFSGCFDWKSSLCL